MENTRQQKLIIIIILTALLVVVIGLSFSRYKHNQVYSAKINLAVAPSGATITINGSRVKPGIVGVKPGVNSVVVKKDGFSDNRKTISIQKGQSINITIALTSNSVSTQSWYQNNPGDETILEQQMGQQYNQQSTKAVEQVPLIQSLPYVSPSLAYRIDYGEPLAGTKVPGIYITAPNSVGQKQALQWIRDQGYDPTTLNIQYNTATVTN